MTDNNNEEAERQIALQDSEKQLETDFAYARANYYDMLEKSKDAVDIAMELARDSEHPRAMEVLGNLIKQNSEITEKLLVNHRQKQEISKTNNIRQEQLPGGVTQNNVYIGSTDELQRMLHSKMKQANVENYES